MKKHIQKLRKQPILFFSLLVTILILLVLLFTPRRIFHFNSVSVINFGDVMFDRGIRNIMDKGRDPFEHIKKDKLLLEGYDVFIANLEGPIVEMDRADCQQKAYNFQFARNTTDKLKAVGINMVNIANNHSFDCFRVGFESTKKYLTDAKIPYIGDRDLEKSYVIKEIRGKKVAFVGLDATVPPFPIGNAYELIKKLKAENNYVVVNIHWGTEYLLTSDSSQKTIAHNIIDNGADVIFGHHPHIVEPVEVYKNGVIFYSLGNFVFDQDFGDTTVGLGASVDFSGSQKSFELFPFNIKKFAPDLMKGEERNNFCQKFLHDIQHRYCTFEIKA